MAFPRLFPYGRCGCFHDNSQPQPSEEEADAGAAEYQMSSLYQYLFRFHDRRFAKDSMFVFWALNNRIRRNATFAVYRASEDGKEKDVRELTVGDLRRGAAVVESMMNGVDVDVNAHKQYLGLFNRLAIYSRQLPGTALYMRSVRRDLLAMAHSPSLNIPTLFITLSANDLWPHITKMALRAPTIADVASVSSTERRKIVSDDKLWMVLHFRDRLDALFSKIIDGVTSPLGTVVGWFKRIEFQDRGAPHLHALLWIAEMKDIHKKASTQDGMKEIEDYVNRTVCCMTDLGEWQWHKNARLPVGYGVRMQCEEMESGVGACVARQPGTVRKRRKEKAAIVKQRRVTGRLRRQVDQFAPLLNLDYSTTAQESNDTQAEEIRVIGENEDDRDGNDDDDGGDDVDKDVVEDGGGDPVRACGSAMVTEADLRLSLAAEMGDVDLFSPPCVNGQQVYLPLYHPWMQRRLELMGQKTQMHKCTFSCWKKKNRRKGATAATKLSRRSKRAQMVAAECRFGFPRAVCEKTSVVFDNGNTTSPKLDVKVRSDHEWLNRYNPFIATTWGANSDCSPVMHGYKTIKYITTYVTKTDSPEDATLSEVVLTRFKNLEKSGKTDLYSRFMAIAMHDIGYQEVCWEQALWIMMSLPLAEASHAVVGVDVSRPEDPLASAAVPCASILRDRDDSAKLVTCGINSKRGRVTNYTLRPKIPRMLDYADRTSELDSDGEVDLNREMCLVDFLSLFDVRSTSGVAVDGGSTLRRGRRRGRDSYPLQCARGCAIRRTNDAIVVPVPYRRVDVNDEDSCYMLLMFYVPFRQQEKLLLQENNEPMTAREAFARACEKGYIPADLQARLKVVQDMQHYKFSDDDKEKSVDTDREVAPRIHADDSESDVSGHDAENDDAEATQLQSDELETATGSVDVPAAAVEAEVIDIGGTTVELNVSGYFGDLNRRRREAMRASPNVNDDAAECDEVLFGSEDEDDVGTRHPSRVPKCDVVVGYWRNKRCQFNWSEAVDFVDENVAKMHMVRKAKRATEMAAAAAGTSRDGEAVKRMQDIYNKLNRRQRLAFSIVREHVTTNKQLQMIVTGVAGTGKSFLCHAIVQYVRAVLGVVAYDPDAPHIDSVVKLAYTGVAANNIDGHTIHSALGFQRNDGTKQTVGDQQRLNGRLRKEWAGVHMVIVDEFSFIGCAFVKEIDARLRIAKDVDAAFGGLHIIFMGDMNQLRPVDRGEWPLFMSTRGHEAEGDYALRKQKNELGRTLWTDINIVVGLNEQMRQVGPTEREFVRVLGLIRTGDVTERDLMIINKRVYDHRSLLSACPSSYKCMWLASTHKVVDECNREQTERLGKFRETVNIFARHERIALEVRSGRKRGRPRKEKTAEAAAVVKATTKGIRELVAQLTQEDVRLEDERDRLRTSQVQVNDADCDDADDEDDAVQTTAERQKRRRSRLIDDEAGDDGIDEEREQPTAQLTRDAAPRLDFTSGCDSDDGRDDDESRESMEAKQRAARIVAITLHTEDAHRTNKQKQYCSICACNKELPVCLQLTRGSRVKLSMKLNSMLGLNNNATGTVVSFLYNNDVTGAPVSPFASCRKVMLRILRGKPQLQVPIVLVKFDRGSFRGPESFISGVSRVVPIVPVTRK